MNEFTVQKVDSVVLIGYNDFAGGQKRVNLTNYMNISLVLVFIGTSGAKINKKHCIDFMLHYKWDKMKVMHFLDVWMSLP